MNVRPAGREACECASPINQILERLDQMDADIASAQQAANTAVGTATAQAGAAAASAASAQADAAATLINAGAAQQAADDAHDEAVAAAGSAQDAADDAADALLALQNIESTIASVLATDIGAKVDKLTTAGFHLYSHNGNSQGEVAPDINPTAATIPIRGSSGKLFGADPASGATDKTLVTANWISQTGDSAPNNLIHKTGYETVPGTKNFEALRGSAFLAQNININNRIYKFAIASSRAYYKYGAVFLLAQVRDEIYLIKLQSGSSSPIHTPTVTNLITSDLINTDNLDWHLGYIEDDSGIYATIRGPAANRITSISFLGGHTGGSGGLRMYSINPEITTDTPTEFW